MKKRLTLIPLVTLLFFTISCQRGKDVAADKETEPTITVDSVISADGVSIAYELSGRGEPALVFIHGWCCDRSYWNAQVPYFAQKYKVVAIDLAGHGDSGLNRKEWTMAAFGEDVVAVVHKLGLEHVVLIGHSMGGSVIVEAGRKIPQRVVGLVGVDTLNDFEEKYSPEFMDETLNDLRDNFVEATQNFVRTMLFAPNSDPVLVDKIVTDMASAPPEVGKGALEAEVNFQNNEIIHALKEAKAPITCINSDMFPTNIETNQHHSPSFKAKIMPGVGHFNMMEDPEIFNRLLEETIQEFVQMEKLK
jgi:pimeloyl-ACP methyl ester carboxylesterase